MTTAEGITTQTDEQGQLTHVTIDVRRHEEALTMLQSLRLVEKTTFERECEDTVTVDEVFNKLQDRIKAHYSAKAAVSEEPYISVEEARRLSLQHLQSLSWPK